MTENLSAVARLRLLVEGAREISNDLERVKEGTLDLDDAVGKSQKNLSRMSRDLKDVADNLDRTGRAAQKNGQNVKDGAKGWDDYSKAIEKAQAAQRQFSQQGVMSQFGPDAIPATSAAQMTSAQRQALLAANDAQNVSVISEARRIEREREQAEEHISDLKRRSLAEEFAAIQRTDAERRRNQEHLDDLKRRSLADELAMVQRIERERTEAARQAVAGIDRMSAAFDSRVSAESALGRQRRSVGQMSMSDWDRQFADLERSVDTTDKLINNAARARYALYDVSSTATITAASLAAVGTASAVAFGSMESSFTNVERTLGSANPAAVAELREELVALTQEIPRSFSDVAQIATLGNQLGVASSDVAQFTETVAKFSTVTGMTAEASATAFGSLGELLDIQAGDYERLGSAIALVGRKSVATESEIVSMSTRLAASASNAGFTAQQVIALSGAFASLRIAPERAQGVMEVYFNRLNTALAEGGDKLTAFAHYSGLAEDQVRDMVSSDPVGFFERLATGLGALDQVAQTSALQQLGLDGIRAGEVFGRVSSNLDVFRQALGDANTGYAQGRELADQYAKVVDDLASKWQIFLNAVMVAGAAVGEALAPALAEAMEWLGKLLVGFAEFATSPAGRVFITIAAVVGTAVAALAGLIAMAALTSASFLAIRTAVVDLGLASAWASGGVRGLVGMLLGVGPAATAGAIGMRLLRGALISTGIGAAIVAVGTLISLLVDFNGTITAMGEPVHFLIDAFFNVAEAAAFAGRTIFQVLASIPVLGDAFKGLASVSDESISGFFEGLKTVSHDQIKRIAAEVNGAKDSADDFDSSLYDLDDMLAQLGDITIPTASDSLDGLADSAQKATIEIRTLKDYANDLSGVFSRAFEIRFGSGQAMDSISSAWNTIAQENADARDAIADYRDGILEAEEAVRRLQQKISSLSADRNTKQYWLSMAEMYGDDLRAAQLREEIAEINLDIADSHGSIADEQKKQSDAQAGIIEEQEKLNRSLQGNSQAAIQNRAALYGLVQGYESYLTALAASGASQATLQSEAARLKQEFINQAAAMGYNRGEVGMFAAAFDDMAYAIERVPRNVNVDANADPAIQAMIEFEARAWAAAQNAARSVATGGGLGYLPNIDPKIWDNLGQNAGLHFSNGFQLRFRPKLTISEIEVLGKTFDTLPKGSQTGFGVSGFATGGYTGGTSASEVAGLVHGKEYVFSAPAVKNLGLANLSYLHNLGKSGARFGAGAGAGGFGGLSASDIDRIARAFARYMPQPVIPGVGIQRGLQRANANANRSGRY